MRGRRLLERRLLTALVVLYLGILGLGAVGLWFGVIARGASIQSLLAFLVIALLPIHWAGSAVLWRIALQERDIPVLFERALAAQWATVVASIFGIVFLNNGMEHPVLDPLQTMFITRLAILSLTIPALYWLWLWFYRNGRRP